MKSSLCTALAMSVLTLPLKLLATDYNDLISQDPSTPYECKK